MGLSTYVPEVCDQWRLQYRVTSPSRPLLNTVSHASANDWCEENPVCSLARQIRCVRHTVLTPLLPFQEASAHNHCKMDVVCELTSLLPVQEIYFGQVSDYRLPGFSRKKWPQLLQAVLDHTRTRHSWYACCQDRNCFRHVLWTVRT